MNDHESTRRRLLARTAALPILLALPLRSVPASAGTGTGSKEDFHYQEHPNEGKRCADCAQFIPAAKGQAGACRIVAGAISADGWCMAFTPRQDRS
ncbi:high-potential iron-sulfur protein [Massilia sp. Root335]|uniref:high-potential iron-sulfur protein n=1 Tax=Massilia sp. Root335 TaxID=1736517 RepID=UPI0006F25788|nr:high-potential iron-sulfur protein [Massilia sp. Root335]KQV43237.1 hypothetical protein ASC93_15705 [Massilia sp. Root335]